MSRLNYLCVQIICNRPLVKSASQDFLLFLDQNICCGYSWDGSFEHPKHMLTIMCININNFRLKIFVYLNL